MKSIFQKFLPPPKLPPAAPEAAAEGSASQQPRPGRPPLHAVVQVPDGLMEELFPEREVMVSAIFDGAPAADAPLSAATATPPELPLAEPPPPGSIETPDVLSMSDELQEAIFPRQKVMVAVIFNQQPIQPLTPEPPPPRWTRGESSGEHDFPII